MDIWQDFIRAYLTGDFSGNDDSGALPPGNPSQCAATSDPAGQTVDDGIHENGHFVSGAPGGGIFCRNCGKFVMEIRHRRLKISKKKCTQADLPQSHWLATPCYSSNPRRLLGLFLDMQQFAGNHELAWNGSVSRQRDKPGHIACLRCGKSWPWDNRHNMKLALCSERNSQELTAGWISMQHALANTDEVVCHMTNHATGDDSVLERGSEQSVSSPPVPSTSGASSSSTVFAQPPVRYRLRSKTSVSHASHFILCFYHNWRFCCYFTLCFRSKRSC